MSFPRYPNYKDSGVAWLGEVPEHWEIRQSRRLFSLRNERVIDGDKQLTASQKHGVIYQDEFMQIEGQHVVQAVSYTHLDVYKRQTRVCPQVRR